MTASLLVFIVRLLCGGRPVWKGCLPDGTQRVYFANHTSTLDSILIWAALPRSSRVRTRPVAARDYWTKGPVRRFLANRVFNAILIDRSNITARNNPIASIVESLKQGVSIIIFPEGGRKPGDEPSAFKSGLYHIARKCPEIELAPVWIDNANRVLPRGELLPVPFLCGLTFGEPMRLDEGEDKKAFLERARNAVVDLRKTN